MNPTLISRSNIAHAANLEVGNDSYPIVVRDVIMTMPESTASWSDSRCVGAWVLIHKAADLTEVVLRIGSILGTMTEIVHLDLEIETGGRLRIEFTSSPPTSPSLDVHVTGLV